jgi:sortase A
LKLVMSRSALLRIQYALFVGGFVLLGYGCGVTADAWLFQRKLNGEFQRSFEERRPASSKVAGRAISVTSAGPIGRLEIERLGISVMVMEGAADKTLRRAAGHISGTALPGEAGNMGISAHRDTFFRPLRNIRRNDIITIQTILGSYRYRVVSTRIVSPQDVSVLASGATEVLTLVTCYPFYFVGAAPDRFIVRAERVS